MTLVARYDQHGETHEQHVGDESSLVPFEQMGHIKNLSFNEAVYAEDVVKRLEETKEYPENEAQAVELYVLNNELQKGSAVEQNKQSDQLQSNLDNAIIELTTAMFMQGGI